jgi:putative restriction endonuclease
MATASVRQPVTLKKDPSLYRFSVAQYHAIIDAGVLHSGDKVELLEGLLVKKMTRKPPHDVALDLANDELGTRIPPGWRLRLQSAITTTDSEPEPDVVVVPGPARRYIRAHPGPTDIALVIEISDTTLDHDRIVKGRIYARARLPVYWIVNIPNRQIEVYTQPRSGRNPTYRQRRDYLPGEKIPLVIAGQEVGSITVEDLLP